MPEPSAGDVALMCMGALIDELARRGVTDVCVSPGSRSTPIVLALARHPGVRTHVILDERSSSFFALGLAKATGRPVGVVTTSGTAVANLLPAVVEAAHSGTPLIVLTADRPPEVRGAGANQTIDQVGIFGGYPRWDADAGVPEDDPLSEMSWRALGERAVAEALGSPGGPVHLNLPFREPLTPAASEAFGGAEPGGRAVTHRRPLPPDEADVATLAALIGDSERGVIMAGSLDPWIGGDELGSIEELARVSGWPLLAEPASGLRRPPLSLAAGQHLLADGDFADRHAPDVVLQLGAAPTTRGGQGLIERAVRLVVASPRPADPTRRAEPNLCVDPSALAREVVSVIGESGAPRDRGSSTWLAAWRAADAAAEAVVTEVLEHEREPFEGTIARDVAAALPDGALLFVGSSMPVRDLDAYMRPRSGVRVIGNRGASGIDGSVSTPLGMAASGAPTFALIGDLALLHDASGLLWASRSSPGVVLVVPNNRGGGIFDHLEVASQPEHEWLFFTPHEVDLAALAAAADAQHTRVDPPGDLTEAVQAAGRTGGVHLLEVPVDREAGVRIRGEVRAAVRTALTGM